MSLKNVLLRTLRQKNKFVKLAATASRFNHGEQNTGYSEQQHKYYINTIGTALFSFAFFTFLTSSSKEDKDDIIEAGEKKPGLPVYRSEEVMTHDSKDSFWVIYKHGVYDVTKFLPCHPGGKQINNAAGLSIEPFWNLYSMHKTKDIYKLLETYRIGNLHDDDVADYTGEELWVDEPRRDARLIIKVPKPFNAEIPAKLQIQSFDTPNELFFIRHHMPVPELDAANHILKIKISDNKLQCHKEFDLETLTKMFPPGEVRAALMCAGNRRTEMSKVRPVRGISWETGAVSNARWSGVYLRDVLIYCGVDPTDTAGKHVILTGADVDATGAHFSTSIPLAQALSAGGGVLLATRMNGAELPRDHGRPLRALVPGAPAVRSVKWLQSITVSYDESSSHWHKEDYRSFNSSVSWETANFAEAPPIYSLPVTSAICDPGDGDTCTVEDGHIVVRGYAYSGGGAKIVRVDVSPDQGRSWVRAHEMLADSAPPPQHYAWTLWAARVPVRAGDTQVELWAKATDSNFNTQPERFEDIWNIRGLLGNAYHRIKVNIK